MKDICLLLFPGAFMHTDTEINFDRPTINNTMERGQHQSIAASSIKCRR